MKEKSYYVTLFEVYQETYRVRAASPEEARKQARRSGTVQEQTHAYTLWDDTIVEEVE